MLQPTQLIAETKTLGFSTQCFHITLIESLPTYSNLSNSPLPTWEGREARRRRRGIGPSAQYFLVTF